MKKGLQKGFTLVELIVVMMLMGLITTAIAMIIRPYNEFYADINNKATEENACIVVTDYINGELRYATGVKVICNDGSTPTAGEIGDYKNFIKLSNASRYSTSDPTELPRGTATHGLTSNFAKEVPCVSGSIFERIDVQFSIAGVETTNGNESLTLGIDAHPLEQNDAKNGFVIDSTKSYNYTETFRFVNMHNQTTIGKNTAGISTDVYDESVDNTIWILYQKPAEAEDKNGTSSSSSSTSSPTSSTESVLTPESTPVTPTPTPSEDSTSSAADSSSTPEVFTFTGSINIHFRASDANAVGQGFGVNSYKATGYTGSKLENREDRQGAWSTMGEADAICTFEFNDATHIVIGNGYTKTGNDGVSYNAGYLENHSSAAVVFDAGSVPGTLWYFNGRLYSSEPQGYVDASAGTVAESKTVTIHFSNANFRTYENGEVNDGYIHSGMDSMELWRATKDTQTVDVASGTSLDITLKGSWYTAKDSISYTYDQLVNEKITDIWIMNGAFYTVKPDDWVD